jgi:hypothetical protein
MIERTRPIIAPIANLLATSPRQAASSPSHHASRPAPWVIAAAPLAGATLWLTATAASFLYWSVTGSTAPLDWCRSGAGLLATAALTITALVTATLLPWMKQRRPRNARVTQPAPAETVPSGWRLDEGQFTTS